MARRGVGFSLFRFVRGRRVGRGLVVGLVAALAWSMATGSQVLASPDWNLGNTLGSQISDINAQSLGVIRNDGLGKCVDDLNGNLANGAAVASNACSGGASQNWTFNRESALWDDGTIHPAANFSKCLTVTSTNGGVAQSIAIGGTVQMLLTANGQVFAKSGVALGGWTKEADFYTQKIAAGSDGTQLMTDGSRVYARNTIGADGWVDEGGSSPRQLAANGGVQMYLSSDGTVYARSGIGSASGWVVESAAGQKAIAVGSDGTQMMIGSDGSIFARSAIGAAGGWVKELAPGAQAIATNGGVQMYVGADNYVFAKTGIGLNGWTKESTIAATDPDFDTAIAAGSDGTQLMVGSDGYLYAKKGVSAGGWTKELASATAPGFGVGLAAGAGGLHAAILSSGLVSARTGIGTTFTTETDLTTEKDNARPVQMYDCHDWDSQHWVFQFDKTGSIQLYNQSAGRCLDTPNSSTTNGTALWIYTCDGTVAQRFAAPTTPAPPTGPITNTLINRCAIPASTTATPAAATAVVSYTCGVGYSTGPLLPWTLSTDGTLMAGGMCLGLNGGEPATANGTLTVMAKCSSTYDQQWAVGWDTSNRPRLVNPNSGRCLDVPNSSTTNGTQLQIYTCNNTNAQVWNVPHATRTFPSPATATPSTIPPGTGYDRVAAMNTAERVRENRARLALVLHAGGSNTRQAAAQILAGPDTALDENWYDWIHSSVFSDDGPLGSSGTLGDDVDAAKVADQARIQREDGREHFLWGYPMSGYGTMPDYDTDVTDFMSSNSTLWLSVHAVTADPVQAPKAAVAEQNKVKEIAARRGAADPPNAWVWNMYADNTVSGSADDVRRFIQYDGWPTVAPEPGTPEFRVEVEALKTRWSQGDPTNPLDPDDVLLDVEETAWAEWQAELNAQAQPRADILAAEMQGLEALTASAETMHDGLGYAWTARGILWAQDQKAKGVSGWSSVDMSHATHDLGLIKAKVAALASAAQNEAVIAKDAADKAVAARTAAYASATAAGLPQGRGLTYAQQSAQVAQAAAAATQATANAMLTTVAATNATLADSATLLANASAQAHAARALYLRQAAQDSAARAASLATQAQAQANAAATAAAKVAADKAKIATVEATAKAAQDRADAAAADAAKQQQIAANAKTEAETQRQKAASAAADAQSQAAIAESKKNDAQAAASRADADEATAKQAEVDAANADTRAQAARANMDKLMAEAAVAEAKAAAAQGTDAADAAEAEARTARSAANDAAYASDQANRDAAAARNAASRARAAATVARSAAIKAESDVKTAEAAAATTHAASIRGHALAADAIQQAAAAAQDAAAARESAQQAKDEAAKAKADAIAAKNEAAGALADSAVAIGQAMATAQAAQETAAAAAKVAAPADEAIALADPWAATDSAAGLSVLSSEAAKTIAQQQADVAAAQATQAAALAAAAQDAANRAAGDAKLAAQAAADAAASASKAAASASAATKSAVQAGADAKAVQQSSARIDAMDAKAQDDVERARASAAAADGAADAAEAAADESERDTATARDAADAAEVSADLADEYADDAEASAASAREAANHAQESAEDAESALSAINELEPLGPQPGQVTETAPSGIPNVYVNQVIKSYSFTPTSDCVGTGGCTVTGNFHVEGYNVFTLVSCVHPTSDPDVCTNTGVGPQVTLDVLAVVPFAGDQPTSIRITQQQLLEQSLRALPGILFGEYIGCAKKLTNNGGSWGDCGWVLAELVAPKALSLVAKTVRDIRIAIAVGDVAGMEGGLAALKGSIIDTKLMLQLENDVRLARAKGILDALNACFRHSFAAGTGVLMADGSVKPIEQVAEGDLIRNATPGGALEVHRVNQVHVTATDTDFTELTVAAAGYRATITGTQNHPFYDLTKQAFVNASELAVGDRLQTTDSRVVTVEAVRDYASSMVTYDLTVDSVHTYFVDSAGVPVLVHNEDPCTAAIQAVKSVAGLTPGAWSSADRLIIEDALGGNLRDRYPFIDSYDRATKTATSIKSIDWRIGEYNLSPGKIQTRGEDVVDELTHFRDVPDNWYNAKDPDIHPPTDVDPNNWVLRLAYPENPSPEILQKYLNVVAYGKTKGIKVILHPIRG
jgi:Ricin-type beta-trefoil lectin domain/Pretoxin HINT domain